MIEVNLLAKKKRKPIQIPFAAIFFVIGLVAIGVLFYLGTLHIRDFVGVEEVREEVKQLQVRINAESSKIQRKDRLVQDKSRIQNRISRLKQLSGASLLQWSHLYSDLTSVVPNTTVWLTSFRVDADRRVQITGYSCGQDAPKARGAPTQLTKGIQDFMQELQDHPNFHDITLIGATKAKFEKEDVWRFDLSCRVTRDLGRI